MTPTELRFDGGLVMLPTTREPNLGKGRNADPLSLTRLIRGLHSLLDGPAYVAQLIAYGPDAIPVLADLLLEGKPSSVSEPRQWIVEALGGLGAYDVLLSYLRRPLQIQSPVIRHGEEAVQNGAARELAACQHEEVYAVLLDCLRRQPLPGFVETLGAYRRAETAPYLIDCLEDDVCRTAAVEALRGFGDAVRALLVEAATIVNPPWPEFESPSSIRRRRCCVRLLDQLHLTEEEVSRLLPLVYENDFDLVIAIAQVLFHTPHFADCNALLFHLNRVKATLGWWLKDEFKDLISEIEKQLSLEQRSALLEAYGGNGA
jgi:hypothetical protein